MTSQAGYRRLWRPKKYAVLLDQNSASRSIFKYYPPSVQCQLKTTNPLHKCDTYVHKPHFEQAQIAKKRGYCTMRYPHQAKATTLFIKKSSLERYMRCKRGARPAHPHEIGPARNTKAGNTDLHNPLYAGIGTRELAHHLATQIVHYYPHFFALL